MQWTYNLTQFYATTHTVASYNLYEYNDRSCGDILLPIINNSSYDELYNKIVLIYMSLTLFMQN